MTDQKIADRETAAQAEYEVTDPGTVWVAGRRVPDNRRVMLTEAEAHYELLAGTIAMAADVKAAPATSRARTRTGGL